MRRDRSNRNGAALETGRKRRNRAARLISTIAEIAAGAEVCWATDLNAGGAALLIELLAAHAQRLLYIPGRIVHHAAATYRRDGKTDANDARIIADQARMRTDLQPVRRADQISVDLQLLTARRGLTRLAGWPSRSAQPTQRSPTSMPRSQSCSGNTTAPMFS